jgi:hypothetical protein
MNKKSYYLFILSLLLLGSCSQKSENPVSELKEKRIHSLNLYLYPSTIRMVNLGNDTTFYQATKNIERIHYLSVDLSTDSNDSTYQAWFAEQNFSEWDELFQASSNGSLTAIYAPQDSDDQYFAYIKTADGVNLIWAEGKIDLNKVVKLMNSPLNLGPISNFLDDKSKKEKRSEIWKKAREEQKRIEQQEDSIKNQEKIAQ